MTRRVDDEEKRRRGTKRRDRSIITLYPDHASRPDPASIAPPAHLSRAAKAIWREKVGRYQARGQKIGGFEDSLAVYCETEAALNRATRRGVATPAMWSAWRRWAGEFYDTPKSQGAPPTGSGPRGNPFSANGRRP